MDKIRVLPLFSGSKGNSALVLADSEKFLIDCGGTRLKISKKLAEFGYDFSDITAIFITHAHTDHVKAFADVLKFVNCKAYMREDCFEKLKPQITSEIEERIVVLTDESVTLGNVEATSFSLPHDSPCSGFRFKENDFTFSYLTDLGYFDEKLFEVVGGSKKVLIESNHDLDLLKNGHYPYFLKKRILSENGHLSNDACAKVIAKLYDLGAREFILGHLSEENNLPELAYSVARRTLLSISKEEDFKLFVSGRNGLDEIV